jgi:hypothetical protein
LRCGSRAISIFPVPPERALRAVGEHQRLKQLILGDELAELDAHAGRVAALEANLADLPQQLPAVLREAQQGKGRQPLAQALATPVADALGAAVQSQRHSIVEALFPVIGPAIRKAVAEAMRDFNDNFNRVLESSFTPRGLRWRLESWRTGLPYSQVALRHSLSYRIDHLFLIDRHNGLVLARVSAPDLPALDADAIAGMLTAIGDFVRDSVGSGGDGGLDSASVGEHLVWVLQGPRANLAAFVRGAPPMELRTLLRERLERIHGDLDAPLRAGHDAQQADAQLRYNLRLDRIDAELLAQETAQSGKPARRWPLVALALLALALLGAWEWRSWQWQRRLDAVTQTLSNWPGLHLDRVDGSRNRVRVSGLIDPVAQSPEARIRALLPADAELQLDLRGYISTDDAIVLQRARARLDWPAGVQAAVQAGVLSLRGEADAAWIARVRENAAHIVGVTAVDTGALQTIDDGAAALRAEWSALARALPGQRVHFVRELEQRDAGELAALLASVQRLRELAPQLRRPLQLGCLGHNDEPGTATTNRELRDRRARWLCSELQKTGLAANAARAIDGDAATNQPTIDARAASLRLDDASPEGE